MNEVFFYIKNSRLDELKATEFDPTIPFEYSSNKDIPKIFSYKPGFLSVAAYYGSIPCLEYLLSVGAEIEQSDLQNPPMRAIHYSIINHQIQALQFLADNGACHDGCIHYAITSNHKDILGYLIKHKIDDINKSFYNMTPLDLCIKTANIDVANVLISAGSSYTPDQIQKCRENIELTKFVELFNSHKSQLIEPNVIHVVTPLHTAADEGNYEEFKRLIEEGKYDVSAVNENGDNALIKAAHRGSLPIVQFILEQPNVDVNHMNKGGRTALFAAVAGRKKDVVLFLLHFHGINPFLRTTNGVLF